MVAQQIEDLLVVDLEETNSDPTVSFFLLLLEDHLQCAWQDASLRAAQGGLVIIKIRVVFGAVADDRVGLACSCLPAC